MSRERRQPMNNPNFKPKPQWLRVPANTGAANESVMNMMRLLNLHTVCEEASCPNCGECFGRRTAAFMILGRECTRNCTFCCVSKGTPVPPDPSEPGNLAEAAARLGLRYVVVTSVTRDDLPDGGASHFASVITAIRGRLGDGCPVIEVLIPDFQGNSDSLKTVADARPEVINHNIETVPRLYPEVRPMANYQRSLELLGRVRKLDPAILTKSGIMLGLGETCDEVLAVFEDLRSHGCDCLTIGQYLAPSPKHHPLVEYITPEQFDWYRDRACQAGFRYVASGPLVRSSYMAEQGWQEMMHPGE